MKLQIRIYTTSTKYEGRTYKSITSRKIRIQCFHCKLWYNKNGCIYKHVKTSSRYRSKACTCIYYPTSSEAILVCFVGVLNIGHSENLRSCQILIRGCSLYHWRKSNCNISLETHL